eukprot:tig00021012_g16990.t1
MSAAAKAGAAMKEASGSCSWSDAGQSDLSAAFAVSCTFGERAEDSVAAFLRAHPPAWAEVGQNVEELAARDLVHVLQLAAAVGGRGGAAHTSERAAAPAYMELVVAVENVLKHIYTTMKPGSRELMEFARAGGFEECLRLVHREHPLMRTGSEAASRIVGHGSGLKSARLFDADLIAAEAGQVLHAILIGGPIVSGEFWRELVLGDRVRTTESLLGALEAAWRPRSPLFPVTAAMIGDLVNVCALAPTYPEEAFALFDGRRLELLLEILRAAVSTRPAALESEAGAAALEPPAGGGPKGAAAVAASRADRAYVAIYCVALVRKVLTSEHPDGLDHPGLPDRLRRLVPRMADDVSALFGVLAGALEGGESGPRGLATSLAALAECTSAVVARVLELPVAEDLRKSALAAGRRLAAAWPPGAKAFKRAWERPYAQA